MASKVIEANSGVFTAGLAVAPVTDWRFYGKLYLLKLERIILIVLIFFRLHLYRKIHANT